MSDKKGSTANSKEQEFAKRYEELCKEFGMQIVFEPRWAQSKDQGDYRLIILARILPLPKEN